MLVSDFFFRYELENLIWYHFHQRHVPEGRLSYVVYHGTDKPQTLQKLKKYDVVITTYETLANEFNEEVEEGTKGKGKGKGKTKSNVPNGMLFGIKWKRVILDEV